MPYEKLASAETLESIHGGAMHFTMIAQGSGTKVYSPIAEHFEATKRVSGMEEIMDWATANSGYKANALKAVILVNEDDSRPEDDGLNTPAKTIKFRYKTAEDAPWSRGEQYLPRAEFEDQAAAQAAGAAYIAILEANCPGSYVFELIDT